MAVEADRALIDATIENLQALRRVLFEERNSVDQRIHALTEQITKWERAARSKSATGDAKPRRKRGEVLGAVMALLEEHETLTTTEIAKRLNLPWSSVRNVVTKSDAIEGDENGYRLKRNGHVDLTDL